MTQIAPILPAPTSQSITPPITGADGSEFSFSLLMGSGSATIKNSTGSAGHKGGSSSEDGSQQAFPHPQISVTARPNDKELHGYKAEHKATLPTFLDQYTTNEHEDIASPLLAGNTKTLIASQFTEGVAKDVSNAQSSLTANGGAAAVPRPESPPIAEPDSNDLQVYEIDSKLTPAEVNEETASVPRQHEAPDAKHYNTAQKYASSEADSPPNLLSQSNGKYLQDLAHNHLDGDRLSSDKHNVGEPKAFSQEITRILPAAERPISDAYTGQSPLKMTSYPFNSSGDVLPNSSPVPGIIRTNSHQAEFTVNNSNSILLDERSLHTAPTAGKNAILPAHLDELIAKQESRVVTITSQSDTGNDLTRLEQTGRLNSLAASPMIEKTNGAMAQAASLSQSPTNNSSAVSIDPRPNFDTAPQKPIRGNYLETRIESLTNSSHRSVNQSTPPNTSTQNGTTSQGNESQADLMGTLTKPGSAMATASADQAADFPQTIQAMAQGGPAQTTPQTVPSTAAPMIHENQLLHQITERFQLHNRKDETRLQIKLSPVELGDLKIDLGLKEGSLRAHVVVSSGQVQEVLERNMSRLKEMLQDQGLEIEEFTIVLQQEEEESHHFFNQQFTNNSSADKHSGTDEDNSYSDFNELLEKDSSLELTA